MKRIAIIGLGLTAAAAISVPYAAHNVSAATQHVCTVSTSPCPSGNLYGIDINSADTQSSNLASTNAVLSSSAGNITCTDSEVNSSSNSDTTNGKISKLEFDGGTPGSTCSTTIIFNPTATITSNTTNTTASVSLGAACVNGQTNCDGTITFSGLNVAIKLSGGTTCTVTGSVTGNFYNPNNSHKPVSGSLGEIQFANAATTITGNFPCPSSGTESAVYKVWGNNPANTPLYITQ